jgi:hypothetical protein
MTKHTHKRGNGRHVPETSQDEQTFSIKPSPEWLKAHGFPSDPLPAEVFGAALARSLEFRRRAISEGHSPEAVRQAVAQAEQEALRERFPNKRTL